VAKHRDGVVRRIDGGERWRLRESRSNPARTNGGTQGARIAAMSSSFFTWFHYERAHRSAPLGMECLGRGGVTVRQGLAAPGTPVTLVCPKCGVPVEMDLVDARGTRMRLEN
jgi:hypothetical protein